MIAAEILDFSGDVGGMMIFAPTTRTKALVKSLGPAVPDDPEASPVKSDAGSWRESAARSLSDEIQTSEEKRRVADSPGMPVSLESRPIFTFKDVNYSI